MGAMMVKQHIENFECECEFVECCQDLPFAGNEWYEYVGNTSMREGVAMAYGAEQHDWYKKYQVSDYEPRRVGEWEVKQFSVDNIGAALHNHSNVDPGRWILPGNYTGLYWHGNDDEEFRDDPNGMPIMSDTPAEIMDHVEFIDKAYGRVLINGLGLGMVAHALLKNKRSCIEHIDIVEFNPEVIELVGHYFKGDNKVTIHHANAFTIEWPEDKTWHCAWHDIWYTINPSDHAEWKTLMRKYAKRVRYQDCWTRRWTLGYLRWARAREEKVEV